MKLFTVINIQYKYLYCAIKYNIGTSIAAEVIKCPTDLRFHFDFACHR